MTTKKLIATAALLTSALGAVTLATPAQAAAAEQFFPILSYRTGPYGPAGAPFADGYTDYLKYVNATGGINGVKASYEECDFAYDTARGVECYERLKGKNGGATVFQPLSTGVTIALTEKAFKDHVPLIAGGYGPSEAADGGVFKWSFPMMATYVVGADALLQHFGRLEGGMAKLKGKKIAYIYHDSGYGKEPIPYLQQRASELGFELDLLPVTPPGLEQKSTWLKVRQSRPDYAVMWSWGVQTSTALKEALATGFPLTKLYGVWWAGSEVDTKDLGERAKGYQALALMASSGYDSKIVKDIKTTLYDKGQGTGPVDGLGSVLYMRGLTAAALAVEGVNQAQSRFGKGKHVSGDQMRWALENFTLTDARIKQLGLAGVMKPISTNCKDHNGGAYARLQTWDGKIWAPSSDWINADSAIIQPYVKAAADKYAESKGWKRRDASDCGS
jgi:branched-chain amino acid transport system substrate-binding protein